MERSKCEKVTDSYLNYLFLIIEGALLLNMNNINCAFEDFLCQENKNTWICVMP